MSTHYYTGSGSSGSSSSTGSSTSGSTGTLSNTSYLPGGTFASSTGTTTDTSLPIVSGSVYYLQGESSSGNTAGAVGYFYPLYTDESLINGDYHSHTFTGLNTVFYMPSSEMNHGVANPPSSTYYGNFTYQEYATLNVINGVITYTNNSTRQSQSTIAVGSVSNYVVVPQNF